MYNLIKSLLAVFGLIFSFSIKAQSIVTTDKMNPAIWLMPSQANQTFVNKGLVQLELTLVPNQKLDLKKSFLNFNEVVDFDGDNSIHLQTSPLKLNQLTIFIVFKPSNLKSEQKILSIDALGKNSLLFTSQNIIDLESEKTISHQVKNEGKPILLSYVRNSGQRFSTLAEAEIEIGSAILNGKESVDKFSGQVAELIIYDRVLPPIEYLKIHSYLAIKYGISLSSQPFPLYLAGDTQSIWDGQKNAVYSNRVCGLGRDDYSGLYQKQASSSFENQVLTIHLNQLENANSKNGGFLANQTFLVWGDNNANLTFESEGYSRRKLLNRKWKAEAKRTEYLKTGIRFDLNQIAERFDNQDSIWLAIDQSGTGEFLEKTTKYYPSKKISEKGIALFSSIVWDEDLSSSDVFTIAVKKNKSGQQQESIPILKFDLTPSLSKDGHFFLTILQQEKNPIIISIYNQIGRKVKSIRLTGNNYFKVTDQIQEDGLYFIRLQTKEGYIETKKFIVCSNK